ELTAGDKIRTTEGAKAELVFEDGSFVRMKEKTTLGVETARQNVSDKSTDYNLDLRVGELMLELQKLKKGSSFKVQTPTAVAAVRGTTYYMRTGTRIIDGVEKVFVEIYVDSDDIILFTNTVSGQSSIVTQGAGAIVYDDGTSEGPYEIPPAAQDAWKSGFDMVYDDSDEGKKGLRDIDEEEDDASEDVDDTTESQDDAQEGALEDQTGEQEIAGLAKVEILSSEQQEEEQGPDSDGDGVQDIEDAFPQDNTIDPDSAFDDIDGNPVTVAGYGSRDELRQAAIDNLLAIQDLREDISDMIDDIQARQFEAVKEEIFDHQVAKVMTDRWGNRVRVEEYVSKPTNDQVQILALNLRTGGPNAGISSLDFQVKFDRDISDTTLRELPWGDYMSNPIVGDYQQLPQAPDQDAQLIIYENGEGFYNPVDQDYPLPENFSLEVKNPYGESVKVVEAYSGLNQHPRGNPNIWYQLENNSNIYINDLLQEEADGDWDDGWGDGWNQANRFTFLEEFADDSWLMGVFYLINDDGSLVPIPASAADLAAGDYLDEVRGVRDLINPDFNLEMVFLSSEFAGTDPNLPLTIAEQGTPGEAYESQIYNSNRTIDVITIPEITEPYYGD
ncbi:MAG: FecR family protein, partial [Omnitrophica bacterium]|nr:FecR family protein [Candidatus Omnitrophota bacterium]